jgi:hypothetical protein
MPRCLIFQNKNLFCCLHSVCVCVCVCVCAYVGFISKTFQNTSPKIKGFITITRISKSQVLRTLLKSSDPRFYRIYSSLGITGLCSVYPHLQIPGFVAFIQVPRPQDSASLFMSSECRPRRIYCSPKPQTSNSCPQIPGFDVSSEVPYQTFTAIAAIFVFHYIQYTRRFTLQPVHVINPSQFTSTYTSPSATEIPSVSLPWR